MKTSFTLKHLIFVTSAIALFCAWVVSNKTVYQHERRAIDQIATICLINERVDDHGGCVCGNWSGVTIESANMASHPVRYFSSMLGVSIFNRVHHVSFSSSNDPSLVARLDQFKMLESVEFTYDIGHLPNKDLHELSMIVGALRLFSELRPDVRVDCPTDQQLADAGVFRRGYVYDDEQSPQTGNPFGDLTFNIGIVGPSGAIGNDSAFADLVGMQPDMMTDNHSLGVKQD